ncbi:MAG: ABC-F type ribosomal protection protein [Lachnospiraceae bacterium]|nr:ABC-F type ribosomal protection protein [Lachnospiraceae bacterium]
MLLSCQNIHKTYPQQTLFSGASFLLEDNDKAAIVGSNGTGKTTLLRMIMGKERPDDGQVIFAKDKTVGYLAQENDSAPDLTIYELMLTARPEVVALETKLAEKERQLHLLQEERSADDPLLLEAAEEYARLHTEFERLEGYSYKSLLTGVLKGLGFTEAEFDKPIATLSGGQKTRAHLAALLFQNPDLIILDEPTNHLDIRSLEWLEGFLKNYKGAVLLVSHDRYFLDHIVTKIIAIEERTLRTYQGNYSTYSQKAAMLYEARLQAYYKQEAEIAHQEAVIKKLRSFNREKSIKRAESRVKKLDKMERLDKPEVLNDKMHLSLEPLWESGKDVLSIKDLSKSFGEKQLFADVELMIRKGEHVAVIGENGTGKTTLLKILTELENADTGEYSYGSKVRVGYYDQEHQELSEDKTLFEEISDAYPDLDNTRIRNTLAAFLFTGDDVYKQIKMLSGGEKGRLSLAKLMLSGANFLILDEPTNHLDIASKEILEQAVNDYTGTLLYVSHDRWFVNRTASRILDLAGKRFFDFPGNYDYYLEKKQDVERELFAGAGGSETAGNTSASTASGPGSSEDGKTDWQQQKALQAQERKKANALKKCEDEIEKLETQKEVINAQLSDPKNGTDLALLTQLTKELDGVTAELDDLYEKWDALSE